MDGGFQILEGEVPEPAQNVMVVGRPDAVPCLMIT